jgi:hypothetical protein
MLQSGRQDSPIQDFEAAFGYYHLPNQRDCSAAPVSLISYNSDTRKRFQPLTD